MSDGKPRKLSKVKTIKLGSKIEFDVVDQPTGRSTYVSEEPNTLTSFRMANMQGVYGFLAHNYLAGKNFSNLIIGQRISINDEEEKQHRYVIKRVDKFQALEPKNPHSNFIDLKKKSDTQRKRPFQAGLCG